MEQELRKTLNDLGFADHDIHLESTSAGKVGGWVVSDRFDDMSQIERQDWLWARLRERLSPDKLAKIVAILTMTPLEVAEDVDEVEDGERLG